MQLFVVFFSAFIELPVGQKVPRAVSAEIEKDVQPILI
jgi:hypothetical protein